MNYTNLTITMPRQNMAYALAEDVGAPELRNPLNTGMRGRKVSSQPRPSRLSLLRRLFGRRVSVQFA